MLLSENPHSQDQYRDSEIQKRSLSLGGHHETVKEYTFESVVSTVKQDLADYFSSDWYRRKLENELKAANYTWKDLEMDNFQDKLQSVVLSESDYVKIQTIINARLNRVQAIKVIPVKQIGFYEQGRYVPDFEWSTTGFYYYDLYAWKQYMGVQGEGDKSFMKPEFGNVYILNLFALGEGFGTLEEKKQKMITTIFHELGGHGVMEYDKGFTPWAKRLYSLATKKRTGHELWPYLWDISEFQSRMMEMREILFLSGKLSSVSDSILPEHISFLRSYFGKQGDNISLLFLSKYWNSDIVNLMNGITSIDEYDEAQSVW